MRVELLLPWLFAEQMPDGAALDTQPLSAWLPSALVQPTGEHSYEKVILQLLGYPVVEAGTLPIATCLYLDVQPQSGALHQVCAQPVHLDASHDNARLLPAQCLSLTADESNELVATLNALWNPDNIVVTAHTPIDWQLSGQDASSLDCAPAHALAYLSVADALPRSSDAAQWRQLLTEAQMLLHEHPVNISRQQRGLRAVNSIWFYGGAALPAPTQAVVATLFSNDPFVQGLAKHSNFECGSVEQLDIAAAINRVKADNVNTRADSGKLVVVDTRLQHAWLANDIEQFINARDDIIRRLLKPVSEAHLSNQQLSLHINDCNGNRFESARATGLFAKLKRVLPKWR